MRHRDLVALREFKEEEARIEAAKKERRERKEALERARRQREREKDRESIAREFHRQLVLEGVQDSHFMTSIPEEMFSIEMPKGEAEKYNREQAEKFARECKEYAAFKSEATFQQLARYLEQNGARIVSSQMLKVAFERLRDLVLIHRNAGPKKPAPKPEPVQARVNLQPARLAGETFEGINPEDGRPRTYTKKEVDKMDAETYRRCFKVLPTISELLTSMAAQRGAART